MARQSPDRTGEPAGARWASAATSPPRRPVGANEAARESSSSSGGAPGTVEIRWGVSAIG